MMDGMTMTRLKLKSNRRRGQTLVESALVFMVFVSTTVGILDIGQVLVTHQMMVERVRGTLRWAVTQPWDGSGTAVKNMILYGQAVAPVGSNPATYLNLTTSNIRVRYRAGTSDDPNDERIKISIINYQYKFYTPWLSRALTVPHPVMQSAAMAYKP